jgi:hypothetical protein
MDHCGEDDIAVFFAYLFFVKVTNRSRNMRHFFFFIIIIFFFFYYWAPVAIVPGSTAV